LDNNDGRVISLNKSCILDKNLKIIESKMFETGDETNSFIGYEDVRMCNVNNQYIFQGMIKDDKKNIFQIGLGTYKPTEDEIRMDAYESPYNRRCEKNWALFEKENELHAIYEYDPLTIVKFNKEEKKLDILSKDNEIPAIFKQFRGSSCGVRVEDELWFVVHIVSVVPNMIRKYYHAIVILDYKTLKYKKMSYLFKFDNKQSVEYCLGLVVEKERILMSYSIFDNSSYIGSYDRTTFCKTLGLEAM